MDFFFDNDQRLERAVAMRDAAAKTDDDCYLIQKRVESLWACLHGAALPLNDADAKGGHLDAANN